MAPLARLEDGTIQITLTIPQAQISQEKEREVGRIAANLEVPGFRKGNVPKNIAEKHIETQDVYNLILQKLLPQAYSEAVKEHKLKPVLNPRFQFISIGEGRDWEIRAVTCQLPEVELGDYKTIVQGQAQTTKIWTPERGKPEEKDKQPTPEEKEQKVISILLKTAKIKIPQILIDEEVEHRLSRLLEQTEKLGLTIDRYLASIGKTLDQLKSEYAAQAKDALTLELALTEVAGAENLKVEDKEIEKIVASSANTQKPNEAQKQIIRTALLRRKALDSLISLI